MYAYTIITLNGRSFTFIADEVEEFGGDYLFSENGDVVATFSKTAITGYFRSEVIDDDEEYDDYRYKEYISKAVKGEEKINANTLYPYDIIERVWGGSSHLRVIEDDSLEALWRNLPDYVGDGINALVIADTSGSMVGRPLNTAVGLAIYFAERNKGAYHNMWMTFSQHPTIQLIKGETLAQKLRSLDTRGWMMNTNLEAAFKEVLYIAVKNSVPQEEMPKAIIVISDMEIDACANSNWFFYEQMEAKFKNFGYKIPSIIFWNVDSRHDTFHADSKRKGVQLVSGQAASTFKNVIDCIGMTPVEAMMKTIDSERYEAITIEQG